jgi:hypothetical protein
MAAKAKSDTRDPLGFETTLCRVPTQWAAAQYERYLTDLADWCDGRCGTTELKTLFVVAEVSRRHDNRWASSAGRQP